MVSEEIRNTHVNARKRVREASQLSLEPLESLVYKSENKKMTKEIVAKEGEMKTSPGLAT